MYSVFIWLFVMHFALSFYLQIQRKYSRLVSQVGGPLVRRRHDGAEDQCDGHPATATSDRVQDGAS